MAKTVHEELARAIQGEVTLDGERLVECSEDFGRVEAKRPALVVRPVCAEDVVQAVRYAKREGLTIGTRALGHSQNGQSLSRGGLLLDMRGMDGDFVVNREQGWFEAGAGTSWKDIVERLKPHGLIPPMLTNNLNTAIGGTCSVAGLGVSSLRYGSQADQCLSFDMVTGEGDLVHCSPEENRDLFDYGPCGLGQLGIMTRIRHRARSHGPRVTSYFLVYDDLGRLMADAKRVMEEQTFDYVESWASPLLVGLRTSSAAPKTPVVQWLYPLHLSFEHDGANVPSKDPRLEGLGYYRHAHTEEQSIYDYIFRCEPLFAVWKHSGHWQMPHPWMELTLPWGTAQKFIESALAELSPRTLGDGRILLWPALSAPFKKPLFPMPPGDAVMGFGILAGMPQAELQAALGFLGKWSDLGLDAGGKRYVSGWLNFDRAKWAAHFGPEWPKFCALKAKYDPAGILSPGVVDFEPAR